MSTSKTPWVRLLLWLKPEQETAISNFLLYWQQVVYFLNRCEESDDLGSQGSLRQIYLLPAGRQKSRAAT